MVVDADALLRAPAGRLRGRPSSSRRTRASWATAGRELGLGRRAPARGRAALRRALRLRRPAQGPRLDRRRPRRPDVSSVDPGPPSLATAGTGDVLTGVLARSSRRASTRAWRRPPRPRTASPRRPGSRPRPARRERRDRGAPGASAASVARSTRHDRPRRHPSQRGRRSASGSAAPSCGRSSRPTATATARPTSAGRRSGRARPRSASPRSPRGSCCDRALGAGPRVDRAWPDGCGRDPVAREAALELTVADGACPGGPARSPEARHRHGPLGPGGAAGAYPQRRRPDDPLRHRRLRPVLHARQIELFRDATEPSRARTRHAREQRGGAPLSR